jgi:hypothetical protein
MASTTGTHNPLLVNYFEFIMDRIPTVTYFCQSIKLPGIGFGVTEQPTILGHPVKVPTGAFRFEELELTYRVDEDFTNWLELQNWIKTTGNYTSDCGTLPYNQKTTDATLLITNSSYKPKLKIHFKQVFPQYVSGINFFVTAPSSAEVVASVKFAHSGYTIERLENA